MNIVIRKDDGSYDDQIRKVIISAFKQDYEANLVERIKNSSDYYVSFIAYDKEKDKVVGHVMISPMKLNDVDNVLALAPVSVLKEYENNGIGTRLIKTAISEISKNAKYKILSVLGSDHYYKRFGFVAYNTKKFNLPFEVEPRFFQLQTLDTSNLEDYEGDFSYFDYFLE